MSSKDKSFRQLESECMRAFRKWEAKYNPKIEVPSSNPLGWVKFLKFD